MATNKRKSFFFVLKHGVTVSIAAFFSSAPAFADDWCMAHPTDIICGFPGDQSPPDHIEYRIPHVASNPYSVTCSSSMAAKQSSAFFDIQDWWTNVYPASHWLGPSYEIWFYVQIGAGTYMGPWWGVTQGSSYSDQTLQDVGFVLVAGPNSINDKFWVDPANTHSTPFICGPL